MQAHTMHTDPGHGWLEVNRNDVQDLAISHYSYTRGDKVYLEEDCDMPLYINKLRSQGVAWNWDDVETIHHEDNCFIRSLDQYIK